jgi:hypothetical protein
VALYGLVGWELEDHWLTLEHRQVGLPNLGPDLDGARLVHLSDLHLSPIMRQRALGRYIELANELQPDFVVITGDFIWASARSYARQVAELLGELDPAIATIAVLGNHDYGVWRPNTHEGLAGLADYLSEHLDAAGVTVLRNESIAFRKGASTLAMAGVGDLWTRDYDPVRAFEGIPLGAPVLGLSHNPDASGDLAGLGADYILAGHTHGKAIRDTRLNNLLFPVVYRQFAAGEYNTGDVRLYVNRGIGPSRRVLENHRPEVAMLTLRDNAGVSESESDARMRL